MFSQNRFFFKLQEVTRDNYSKASNTEQKISLVLHTLNSTLHDNVSIVDSEPGLKYFPAFLEILVKVSKLKTIDRNNLWKKRRKERGERKKEKLQNKSQLDPSYHVNRQQEFKGKHSPEQWIAFSGSAVAFHLTSYKEPESCFLILQVKSRGPLETLECWSDGELIWIPNWLPDKLQKHSSTHCDSRGGSMKALGWAKHASPGIWKYPVPEHQEVVSVPPGNSSGKTWLEQLHNWQAGQAAGSWTPNIWKVTWAKRSLRKVPWLELSL